MRIYTLLTLGLIFTGLSACAPSSEEGSQQKQDALLNSQRAPLDKAHEIEQMMQDRQQQLDQRIENQTR